MSVSAVSGDSYAVSPPAGLFSTGVTLGVTVYGDGVVSVVRDTSSVEDVADTGVYTIIGTAPSSAGYYSVVVDDGSLFWVDDLVVSLVSVPGTVVSGTLDVTGTSMTTLVDTTVIPDPDTLLKVSGLVSVAGSGDVSLSTNRGTSSQSHRPSVDATYLRNFPIHRNIGGSRP